MSKVNWLQVAANHAGLMLGQRPVVEVRPFSGQGDHDHMAFLVYAMAQLPKPHTGMVPESLKEAATVLVAWADTIAEWGIDTLLEPNSDNLHNAIDLDSQPEPESDQG